MSKVQAVALTHEAGDKDVGALLCSNEVTLAFLPMAHTKELGVLSGKSPRIFVKMLGWSVAQAESTRCPSTLSPKDLGGSYTKGFQSMSGCIQAVEQGTPSHRGLFQVQGPGNVLSLYLHFSYTTHLAGKVGETKWIMCRRTCHFRPWRRLRCCRGSALSLGICSLLLVLDLFTHAQRTHPKRVHRPLHTEAVEQTKTCSRGGMFTDLVKSGDDMARGTSCSVVLDRRLRQIVPS